jgi:hypothetical protein
MSKTRAREGDFVETSDGLFFDVKGLVHPRDRIIAYLRYYPHSRGARLRQGKRYAKVYDLIQRNRLLRDKWPQYLYYDDMQGRQLQGVPKASVLRLHKPELRLISLLNSRHKDVLENRAAKLVTILSREFELPLASFGVSGSVLVGLHRPESDIDIVVYGTNAARRVREAMLALLEQDKQFHRYSAHGLKKIYLKRALQNAIRFNDFVKQEQRKVLQGDFLDSDYFIRCVKDWQEVTESYGDVRYRPMGRCGISAEISDDTESLLSPCRYSLERVHVFAGKASLKPQEVVSFRGRFAEQVRVGERVIAQGRLETVQCRESHYCRLVVGEARTDILKGTNQVSSRPSAASYGKSSPVSLFSRDVLH